MSDASALIEKHKGRGVLVDTNLFVLLLVGEVNPARIVNFKRTQDFTVEDFRMLQSLVQWFGPPIFTTPHILSQVSDLTDLQGEERIAIRKLFKTAATERVAETYDAARDLVQHPLFVRFGLGDASVAAVCERKIVVLTADVQLQDALGSSGVDAINFNHVRMLGWQAQGSKKKRQ
jgi:rRNA-processing protein FCF1